MNTKAKQKPTTVDVSALTVKQLRGAKYNPRNITDSRLAKLKSSISTFGDLSGVVFNIRTKTLVSGHQRLKTIGDATTKIVQKSLVDKMGTVSVGHIEATTDKGIIRIPFRAVDWDLNKEKAANIAANAHGGNFDKEKLALIVADLEKVKNFDIELVGLDPLTLKSLRLVTRETPEKEEFPEYGTDLADNEKHTCPKCSYRFT
jgi:ParB-like chromosome segregation protein Spo0J